MYYINLLLWIIKEIFAFMFYILSLFLWYIYTLSEIKNKNSKLPKIVLMSGFTTQNPIMFLLKKRLENLWYSVVLANLWLHLDEIEEDAKKLDRFLQSENIKNYIYIWFSIGWVIWLYYKKNYPNTMIKLISLWSPYYWTIMANIISFIPSVAQLLPNSLFLKKLNSDKSGLENIYSIWTKYDEIVVPYKSSRLSTWNNFTISEIGHFHLLFSKRVFKLIEKILNF